MGMGLEKDLVRDHEVPFFGNYGFQTRRAV